MLGFKMEF